jgi:hypothetical protein
LFASTHHSSKLTATSQNPADLLNLLGYKKIDKSLDFADIALASSIKHNRSLKLMEKIDKAIDWSRVESILLSHYVVGTSSEGADAYPPLLLFKCFMTIDAGLKI